jgi:hypothetical protein
MLQEWLIVLTDRLSSRNAPELVNDGVATAPSKRIMNAYPRYRNTVDGPLVIQDAGLASIRSSCPHADDWLRGAEARM